MRFRILIFLFILFGFAQSGFAQSDFCADAIDITPGNTECVFQRGSSANASQTMATCSGGGNADDDVWYKFVANQTEMHIKVNPSDSYDAVIQLLSGACGSLSSVKCQDVGGTNITEELIATGLTIGVTYYVRVYHYGVGSGSDDFTICITGVAPVTNDVPCSAIALPTVTQNCTMSYFTTSGATNSGVPTTNVCGADPNMGYNGGDVWFSVVVPSNGIIDILTQSSSVTDGAMELFTGACGSLTRVGCSDDAIGNMPYISQSGLTAGTTVYIRFWQFNNTSPGSFGICVSSPLNDDCADATLICDLDGYGGVTSSQYTIDHPDNMYGIDEVPAGPFGTGYTGVSPVQIDNNSWIKFVANEPTATLFVDVEFCVNNKGMQMQIFSSDGCTNFAAVSNFLETTSSQAVTATGLIPGETYYIVIDGFAGDICAYTITAESGVQVVEVTSSAGTSVCPGQPTQLTAESSGTTVAYSWSANPGGAFGTGQQTETVNVNVQTVYTVTVSGFCDAAQSASITITPDKTITADFYAATSPGSVLISPFPTTMTCEDSPIELWASDSTDAGAFLSPALVWVFTTDANTVADNTRLEIFENGVSFYTVNPLPANYVYTLYAEHLSPTSNYTFTICDDANNGRVIWDVYDGNSSLLLGTDTLKTGNPCVTYGPFSPIGTATWSINTVGAALTQSDNGFATFDPQTAGVGTHQITYSWDNSVGCSDNVTKSIQVLNPHDASWNSPGAICENVGILTLTDYIDVSASSTTGVWSGTGVSGDTFDPSGLSGNISVTYTVVGTNCQDAVTHVITVNSITTAVATTITSCDDGTGDITFDLSANDNTVNGGSGASVSWFTDAGATSAIATPGSYNSGSATVYTVVTNASSCSDTTAVDLVLNPQPPIATASMSLCDDGGGTADFDLTTMDNTINTGNGNVVGWFSNAAATSSIATPTTYTSASATVYAVVTDGATSCTDTISATLTMLSLPSVNNLNPTICEDALGSGTAAGIDLTSNETNINNNAGINFNWLDNTFTPVATPTNVTVSNGDVFNVSVSNASGCAKNAVVTYNVTGTIALSDPSITYCEDDFGLGTVQAVDLTTYNSSIYTGSGTETFVWFDDLAATSNVPDETNVTLDNGTYDTFVVSVTDGTCTQNITITVTINSSPVTVPSSMELCDDQSGFGLNATFDLTSIDNTVNNGTANSVSWFDDVAALIPSSSPGSYSSSTATVYAVVTDGNSCSDTTTLDLIVNPLPIANVTTTNATCYGFSDGTATAVGSDGTGAYTFLWSQGGQTTAIATGLDLGVYTVTISDTKNCSTTTTTTLTEPTQLTITSTTLTQPLCNSGTDGSINLAVSGGTTNYSFQWNFGAGSTTETGLSANNYDITITDANGCSITDAFNLGEPSAITVTTSQTNNSCASDCNGIASVTITGGVSNYNFVWSNTSTANSINNLCSATYTLSGTDGNSCPLSTTVTITEPQALSITLSGIDLLCNGDGNGIINTTVTGGTPTYNYTWSNGPKTQSLTGLSGGIYTLTVTDAITPTACFASQSITINEPSAITVTSNITDISCAGGSTGAINTTVTGGTINYTFTWSNSSTTQSLSGLTPGNYDLTVTDNNNCASIQNYNVAGSATALSTTITQNNISCNSSNDGDATISAGGGATPYSFIWNTSATTNTISGLSPSGYQVTATDNNGCFGVESITITEPSQLSVTLTKNDISCNGANDGAVTGTSNGGTTPYTFLWSNNQSILSLSGLSPNVYQLTTTDGNNCNDIQAITITEPALFGVTTTVTNISCGSGNSGSIVNNPSGGTPSYSFIWSNSETTQSLTGLAPGSYSFTATDNNNCTANGSYTITGSPDAISISSQSNDISCYGQSDGSAGVTVTGGTTPYSYLWSTNETTSTISGLAQGIYDLSLQDAEGCGMTSFTSSDLSFTITEPTVLSTTVTSNNVTCFGFNDGQVDISTSGGILPYSYSWNTLQTTSIISGISTGTYNATVTDLNNCFVTITSSITEPPVLSISDIKITDVLCFGDNNGAVSIKITGGTTAYSFNWSSGGSSTGTINSLGGGAENVTVSDANNCSVTDNFTITEPPLLTLTTTTTDVSCNGFNNGEATAVALGGLGSFDYLWSNNETTDNINGLFIGTYSVTVVDDNNCTKTAIATISEPSAISVSSVETDALCFGGSTGQSNVTVTGGVPGYEFFWDNGQTTQDLQNVPKGVYSLRITDSNTPVSCRIFYQISISEPSKIISTVSTTPTCVGSSNGNADITSSTGGVSPYTYLWSNGQSGIASSGLAATTYNVTTTDNTNCSVINTFTVTTVSLPSANLINPVICEDGDSALYASNVDLTYFNGDINDQAGNTVSWYDNTMQQITTPGAYNLASGDFVYAMVDDGKCQNTAKVTFTTKPQAHATLSGGGEVCEDGSNSVSIRFDFTGTTPLSFTYSHDGEYTQITDYDKSFYVINTDIDGAGEYEIIVLVNGNNCANDRIFDTISVQPVGPIADFTPNPDFGNPPLDVSFVNNSTNTGFETYYWQFGDVFDSHETQPNHVYIEQGSYTAQLLVEDFRGCTDTATYVIQVGDSSYFEIPTVFTPNGDGINDIFKPIGYNILDCEGEIYNRWGEKVFIFDRLNMAWDGRTFAGEPVSEGTYFFVIKATGYDGTEFEETGTLSLIR